MLERGSSGQDGKEDENIYISRDLAVDGAAIVISRRYVRSADERTLSALYLRWEFRWMS